MQSITNLPGLPQASGSPHPSGTSIRILYAEDEPITRELVQRCLDAEGFAVKTARDGLEAWRILVAGGIDLLITDNQMPRMTGLQLATRARRNGMSLPIVVTSGTLSTVTEVDLLGLGLVSVLMKPFDPTGLLDVAKAALQLDRPAPPSPTVSQAPRLSDSWTALQYRNR
jgi:DNA-binding response OmpR family regulator